MSLSEEQNEILVLNTKGDYLIGIEKTDEGVVQYFQNEHDIDLLISKLEEAKISNIPSRNDLLLSNCRRSTTGSCIGSCTDEAAICIERGSGEITFCACT